MLARFLIVHIASGQSFLTGSCGLLAAIGSSALDDRRGLRAARRLLACVGVILVAASATPLPPALSVSLILTTALWVTAEAYPKRWPVPPARWTRTTAALAWALAMAWEGAYHLSPRLPLLGRPTLGVIGDSITAGVGDRRSVTWPALLADRHQVTTKDHSVAGATVASALRQAARLTDDERLVLLEIGGNDLHGGTPPGRFEADLNRLLEAVKRPGRVLVMLEWPLPPGFQSYGRIQRRLAAKHRVFLIPKRLLMGVLLRRETTLDSVHLSPAGQEELATALWRVLRAAYARSGPGVGFVPLRGPSHRIDGL